MHNSTCLLALLGASLIGTPAAGSEPGGAEYPNGAEGFSSAALPPPGTYLLLYGQRYEADEFTDGNGDPGLIPGFRVGANAAVARLTHVTGHRILGASYGAQIIVPLVDVEVEAAGTHDQRTAFGDVTLTPIILGWHFGPEFHVTAALDINVPTGAFTPRRLANTGRNHWNIEPVLAAAYYGRQGIRADIKLMYDFNFENENGAVTPFNPGGAPYRSGDVFHADFALGYDFGRAQLGVSGYYLQQVGNDRVDETAAQARLDALDGFRGEAFAVGPSARASIGRGQLILSWQHELHSEYRARGNKFWLKGIIPF